MAVARSTRTVAERLASMTADVLGGPLPIRLRAWDGSEAGPVAGPVLVLHSRRALRRLLWSPGESGLAQAYIAGDLDIEGELAEGLSALSRAGTTGSDARPHIRPAQWPRVLAAAARLSILGPRPPAPGSAALRGRQHTGGSDLAATSYPDEFYELMLDPSMAYSCGYFVDGPTGGLAAAQQAKMALICQKLDLRQGSRHLDVDCGFGSLICHAAQHHGTYSTGVTRSRQQYEYVRKRVAAAGLADRVQVRLADHRELGSGVDDGRFDAVSAIEMGEDVGDAGFPAFAGILHRVLRPGGRALVQQLSRGKNAPGGALLATAIVPGLHLESVGTTVSLLGAAGLEVRDVQSLREHYDWTRTAWAQALERSWNGAVDLIGEVGARAWRLHLVGGAVAFAENRMDVHQILAVRPAAAGVARVEI